MANRYSIGSGLASNPAVWDGGASVPVTGDRVLICAGHTITLDGAYEWGDDGATTITINGVSTTRSITLAGKLSHSRSVSSSITCRGGFQINAGGEHDMGTVASPIPQGVDAIVYVNKSNSAPALGKYMYECLTGGKFTYVGAYRVRHCVLTAAASAAATTILVSDATGWQPGDLLHVSSDSAGTHQNVNIAGGYTPGSLSVPLTAGLVTSKRQNIAVANATSNVTITSQSVATRGGWGAVTSATEVANTREIRNAALVELTGAHPYNGGVTFRCADNYAGNRYPNPYTALDGIVFGGTTSYTFFNSQVGANIPLSSPLVFTNSCALQLGAGVGSTVGVGGLTTFENCLFSSAAVFTDGNYNVRITNSKIVVGNAGSTPIGGNQGGNAVFENTSISGLAYAPIQYSSFNVIRHQFKGCDFGASLPITSSNSGFFFGIAPVLVQSALTNCNFGPFLTLVVASQARMTDDSYIKVINKNADATQQEDWRYNYVATRSNAEVVRGISSLAIKPITAGLAAVRSQEIYCAAGASIRLIGYIKSDALFFNGGGAGWFPPTVSVSGLGVTTGTVNGVPGVAPSFAGTASATWEKYDITVTNTSGADGYFSLDYTVTPRAVTTGTVYFDGVTEAPFVTRVRHYGFTFDESNPVRLVNPTVSASEATAAAYTGLAVTWSTSAVALGANKTFQALYDHSQYLACQPAGLPYAAPLAGVGTAGAPALFAVGAVDTTGYTLNGSGSLSLGAQTLTASLPWPYTYTGGTFSQAAAVPTFNGGQLNIGAAGSYAFTLAGATIVSMTPAAPGTYAMGGASFTGTVDLRNTAAHAITVQLPAGTSYTTASNTGGAITVALPATYQSVTVNGLAVGSRVQVYDLTSGAELANAIAGASSYTWTDSVAAIASRAIRLRVAHVAGAVAKSFIEAAIGTCGIATGDAAISYLASQVADTTYNTNAIDGSTVTGITIAPAPARVSINIAGGAVTWPQIYAYQVYWLATAAGIADQSAFITAPDTANYLLTGFDVRNTSATPLTITGGYGRDAVTGLVKDCIDVAGSTGNIYPMPDHAIPYSSGSGLTAGQDANLAAVASGVASITGGSAVVSADVKKMNGATVQGSGVDGDLWRGA